MNNQEDFNISVERDGVVFDVEGTWAYSDPAYRDYGEVTDYLIYHKGQIITEFLDSEVQDSLVDEATEKFIGEE